MVGEGMADQGARWLGPDATEVAFPLGGVGTGTISLGARGDLRDFEIWNEPRKGLVLPHSNFILRAQAQGAAPVTRVMEGLIAPPYTSSHGIHPNMGGGLPRFAQSRFRGRYPVAELELRDPEVPVRADLLAYSPLVPLDPDDSGLPCIVFRWRLTNVGSVPVEATIVASLLNPAGYGGLDNFFNLRSNPLGESTNRWREDDALRGIFFAGPQGDASDLAFGNAVLATPEQLTTAKPAWQRGRWYDSLREFWDDLAADGLFDEPDPDVRADGAIGPEAANVDPGSLGTPLLLVPGESRVVTFLLAWYFPNRVNGWDRPAAGMRPTTRIRYAGRFADAWEVARYAVGNLMRLEAATFGFRDALFGSTLPAVVRDAISSTIVVARSNTCFWLEDGRFFGWEGCFDRGGSCHGSCTHVWNYAQTLAFLFPSLEASMLRTAFVDEVDESGKMRFRSEKAFGGAFGLRHAAADGQLGAVIRLWRTFLLTGDRDLLAVCWPNLENTLRYAFSVWDTDGDLVLDGEQHNTYDIEFYGPNPLTGVLLLGALRSAALMSERLGDSAAATRYREQEKQSAERLEHLLWNGEYYRQHLDDVDANRYQHGEGCLSDQVLGQSMAHVAGLGHLLPEEHIRSAVDAVYRHNFRHPLGTHVNLQRTYALAEESGLLLCSWPRGGQPRQPFVYSDEVWSGIEYQVAAHLIYEGRVAEGLALTQAVRARYDGYRRNPWDEVECGHHYARSMAGWALLPALTGFSCDVDARILRFAPVDVGREFRTLFTCGAGWGIYIQTGDGGLPGLQLIVKGGNLEGFTLEVQGHRWRIRAGDVHPIESKC